MEGDSRGRPIIQTIDKNSVSVSRPPCSSLSFSLSHYRRRGSDAANIQRGGKGWSEREARVIMEERERGEK